MCVCVQRTTITDNFSLNLNIHVQIVYTYCSHANNSFKATTSVCPRTSCPKHLFTTWIIGVRLFPLISYLKLLPHPPQITWQLHHLRLSVCLNNPFIKTILSSPLHRESKPTDISTSLFPLPILQLQNYMLLILYSPHFLLHYTLVACRHVEWSMTALFSSRSLE
jgi:hypothetical protein